MSITYIRRFISRLPKNQIFTTREVLIYGSRGTVDQSLRRLVNAGIIVRLARGVFIREGSNCPDVFKVAKAKCLAYCKQITQHGADLAAQLGLIDKKNQQTIFTTTGRSSSFWCGNILIKIKGISHRKMKLGKNKVGKTIASLWYLGKNLFQPSQINEVIKGFSRIERQQCRLFSPLVPQWLDDFIDKTRYPLFIEQQERMLNTNPDNLFEIELKNQCDEYRALWISESNN